MKIKSVITNFNKNILSWKKPKTFFNCLASVATHGRQYPILQATNQYNLLDKYREIPNITPPRI